MATNDQDAASEPSLFLELERAAKAVTVADSRDDARRLRLLFQAMQQSWGKTPGPATTRVK